MPLLAGLPVIEQADVFVDRFVDTRTLALRSLDGQNLLPFTGSEFIAQWGMQNLDVPPREVVLDAVPGMDGARITDITIGVRKPFLPIWFGSDTGHLDYLDRRDGLRSLFAHYGVDVYSTDGTFDLVANSRDGNQERTLRCLYESGMDGSWAKDSSGVYWESVGLNLVCARTFWYGERWSTPPIYAPEGELWFGPFPGGLSSSRALGKNIPVTVTGHVPSWAQIDAGGPCTSLTVSAPGLQVTVPGGLAAGEQFTLITDPRGRTALFNGAKNWARVGPTTRWRELPVGEQKITVDLPGATSATWAVVSGDSRYEGPW